MGRLRAESKERPYRRILSAEQEREICERYAFGEAMPRLAEVYAVSVKCIDDALTRGAVPKRSAREAALAVRSQVRLCRECGDGVKPNAVRELCPECAKLFCRSADCGARLKHAGAVKTQYCSTCKARLRYQKRPQRLCRVCGRMGAGRTKRDLCNVHIGFFCRVCDQPIPAGRVNKRCTDCERAHKEKLWAKPGRKCSVCAQREVTTHSSRCSHCLQQDYEIWRYIIRHMDRPCRKCGVTLARGRRVNYCPPCQRQRMRERNKRRMAIGAHRCAMCKEELPVSRDTYCAGCSYMLAQWRKSWHEGNPIARALGTVRTTRRWQEAT